MSEQNEKLTKEEALKRYITSLDAIEVAMQPYKDHKSALKQQFKENGWLTKQEMSMALKAYRMMQDDLNIDDFVDIFNTIKGQ